GAGYYVPMVVKGETRLDAALNAAIDKLKEDGRLEKIYDKWEMGGRSQVLALRGVGSDVVAGTNTTSSMWYRLYEDYLPLLLSAAGVTVFLAFTSMPIAVALGMLIAVGRMYGPRWLAFPLTTYVEVMRGTPLMLQLYAIFFLLPQIGIQVEPLTAAILGLSLNYAACEAEIYRAGLQAVPGGQMEAALALGMSRWQAVYRVVLPQATRIVIPPVANDFIFLFKDTSVCSVVTVVELTKTYSVMSQTSGAYAELAALTAILYLAMSYPLSLFARWLERKLRQGENALLV
ncbi:MAG: ABC transporter substrate-binding protein/permease, partial [Planctomycetia bacterium]